MPSASAHARCSPERAAAVKAALPEGYDPETRVVAMTAEAPQSGGYVIVS